MYFDWCLKHFPRLTDLSKEFYTTLLPVHTHIMIKLILYIHCLVAICSMLSKEKSVGIELPTFSSPNNVFFVVVFVFYYLQHKKPNKSFKLNLAIHILRKENCVKVVSNPLM